MTLSELKPLLPLILLSALAVLQMLVIAVTRSHQLISRFTVAGLIVTLASFKTIDFSQVYQITPLFTVDGLGLFFALLVVLSCILVVFACGPYVEALNFKDEFYLLIVLACVGACVLVVTKHLVTFFLGLEILGISLVGLIAYPVRNFATASDTSADERKSAGYLEAAIKFLVLSATATAFVLMGMALFYANTGSLLIGAGLITEALSPYYTAAAICLILVGLGFKLSLVPFQFWTPDVYDGAPMPIAAFIASVSKAAVLLFMLRFFTDLFGISGVAIPDGLLSVVSLIAVTTILVGNFMALLQTNIKRLLGYSSIAHMGYVLVLFVVMLVFGQASEHGSETQHVVNISFIQESLVFYIVVYMATMIGAFLLLSAYVSPNNDRVELDQLSGLFWRSPVAATLLTVMLLSLAGIPLTAGFVAKFYIFGAAVDQGMWFLIAMVILGSGVGLFYYLRIVLVMSKNPEDDHGSLLLERQSEDLGTGFVVVSMTGILLFLGVYPQPLMALIGQLV